MYRPEAMSALGPDHKKDVTELMGFTRQASKKTGVGFVIHWRKQAGLLYYERQTNGRFAIKRYGQKAFPFEKGYATEAGARGRIAWETKQEGRKRDAA